MGKKDFRACMHCGHRFPKDRLFCPSCKQWNIEAAIPENDGCSALSATEEGEDDTVDFLSTGPWDPCFGRLIKEDGTFQYGIAKGSVNLLGGKNGAGKSTMVLQICEGIIEAENRDVLIVSVEEPKRQVRRLGKRLKLKHMDRMQISKAEVSLDLLLYKRKPALLVVDSLQALCPDPDSAVEFCKRLKGHAEELNIPAILINHINKEEEFAGFESLQHYVDATLLFTIYDDPEIRELRSLKNRNGELARRYFDMTDMGLAETELPEDDEDEDDE